MYTATEILRTRQAGLDRFSVFLIEIDDDAEADVSDRTGGMLDQRPRQLDDRFQVEAGLCGVDAEPLDQLLEQLEAAQHNLRRRIELDRLLEQVLDDADRLHVGNLSEETDNLERETTTTSTTTTTTTIITTTTTTIRTTNNNNTNNNLDSNHLLRSNSSPLVLVADSGKKHGRQSFDDVAHFRLAEFVGGNIFGDQEAEEIPAGGEHHLDLDERKTK